MQTTISVVPHGPPEFTVIEPRGRLRIPVNPESSHPPIKPTRGNFGGPTQAVLTDGRSVPAIEFVCDDKSQTSEETTSPTIDPDRIVSMKQAGRNDLPAWIERLRNAGIWADRRNSPDLLSQLLQATKRPIDTLICNLLDADSTTCLNAALAARFSQELIAGVTILANLCGANRTILCTDHRFGGSWTNNLRSQCRSTPLRLIGLANDFPQADPTLLLYTLLDRRLRPGRLPTELGAIVIDAAAAIAVGRVVLFDEPMIRVPMVVRNHPQKLSHFLFVPIGMGLNDLLPQLSWHAQNDLVRGGDLLRDIKIPRDAVASGSELVVHTSHPEPGVNPEPCIRCGWCIEACPTRVRPAFVLEAAQRDDLDLAESAGIEACIECGICSYVCPSKLPLLEGIRKMRREYVS